jgi:Negative regulator of beta-lactamase expression
LGVIERPSPNHDDRDGAIVDMLVLHYTGMQTAEAALDRLCDSAAKVSAHYTVDEDGTVYAHVPEARRAWHAGISFWPGSPTSMPARSASSSSIRATSSAIALSRKRRSPR